MMPTLTTMFGPTLKRLTNNSTRVTSIRSMKRGGASDRDMTTVTGHRTAASLIHYDPIATNEASLQMASSIANAGLKAPRAPVGTAKSGLMPLPRKSQTSQKNYYEPRINPFVEELTDEFFDSQLDKANENRLKAIEFLEEVENEKESRDDPDWKPEDVST